MKKLFLVSIVLFVTAGFSIVQAQDLDPIENVILCETALAEVETMDLDKSQLRDLKVALKWFDTTEIDEYGYMVKGKIVEDRVISLIESGIMVTNLEACTALPSPDDVWKQ